MSSKLKGIIVPPVIVVLTIVIGIITAAVIAQNSTDGWAALGALLGIIWILGLAIIVIYIVGLFLHYKKKSEFGLGLLIGMTGTLAFFIVLGILINFYNLLVS
jgi:membrane protein CcdC involved in cytochrome C biogenesis